PLGEDGAHVDFRPRSADQRNHDDSALESGDFQIARDIAAGNHVQGDVDPLAPGLRAHHLDEVLRAVIDSSYGAKPLAGTRLVVRSCGRENARSPRRGELDGGGADAAGAAMNKHGVSRLAMAAIE